MKYKLIVLDLDGTLTNSKKVITPRNREILIRVQEQGVRLVLASGRPTYGIVPLANELRMNEFGGFILSYNGGEIINWETQEMLYEFHLPVPCALLDQERLDVHFHRVFHPAQVA